MKGFMRAALGAWCLSLAGGCATAPHDPAARAEFKANDDPLEPMNRCFFAFNQSVDRGLIRPIAVIYLHAVPPKGRLALRRVLANLNEPVVMANCLLQGRFKSAGVTAGRFVVNSTIGIAGVNDVATGWKLPKQVGDFGQTLWTWGMGEGPYLIVPVFGPNTPRDGVGEGIDIFIYPLRYLPGHRHYPLWLTTGRVVAGGIDERARNLAALDEIQRESIDYYAAFRSFYRQNRAAELRNGKPAAPPPLPPANFYDAPGP